MIPKIKYQLLSYLINSPDEEIKIDAETDKLYNTCTGINIVISNEYAKFSTLTLDINNREVFPEKFEILRIVFRDAAPFGYDFHTLDEPAGGSKISGVYRSIDPSGNVSYPYILTIALKLENTIT